MTRSFLWVVFGVATFSPLGVISAQQAGVKPVAEKFVEVHPYPAKTYQDDRGWTGAFFRKLRNIRAAEGNAAAAARIPGAWKAYLQLRINYRWNPKSAFDDWGFWVWHEAQFDTGKNDPEWSLLLYRSIYNIALADKKYDWAAHARPNLIGCYGILCQWGNARALSNEAEDYFAGIGFDLDPQKLPATGPWDPMVPFVKQREFPLMVPNSMHVVSWQRQEQKDPAKPSYMDNLLIGLMYGFAVDDSLMGHWDRAMERCLWIQRWSDEIKRLNSTNDKEHQIKRFHDDSYRQAILLMSSTLSGLGYSEKALKLVDRGLARKGASQNNMIDHTNLEIEKAALLMASGNVDGEVLKKMDAAIGREGKFPSISLGDMDSARYVKADYLVKMGKLDEAGVILQSICKRKDRKIAGWMYAELQLVDLMLTKGEFAKAEKTLYELMEVVRVKGVKIEELSLYRKYVKWAMLSGNWHLALQGQREVMRLVEAFRMTPIMPAEQAILSRIMAELGNLTESDRLAELAKSGSVGREKRFIQNINDELAKRPKAGLADTKSKVMIQPRRVITVALDKFQSRAVVSLVNQGSREAKGKLKITGLPSSIAWDQKTGFGAVEVNDAAGSVVEKLSDEIHIAAGDVAVFSCSAKLANKISKTVFIEWVEQNAEPARCEWIIDPADKESVGAVIDAGEYKDDPFFLIPIYHHLQSNRKGQINLRVVTSQPCRVEMYGDDGTLQMVDSAGNGSLQESGDWLGIDLDRNLAADLLPDEKTGETRFLLHIDPMDWTSKETIKVRVEWLADGEWFLAAEDQIVFGK